MSASSAGYLSAMAVIQKAPERTPSGKAAVKSAVETRTKGLDILTAFIPSEALTLYIAGLAVVSGVPHFQYRNAALWTVLIVAAFANFLIGLQSFTVGLKTATPALTASAAFGGGLASGRFWAQLILTEIAFALYVMALPNSPILELWRIDVGWGGLLVVLVAPLIAVIGNWGGLTPTTTTIAGATTGKGKAVVKKKK